MTPLMLFLNSLPPRSVLAFYDDLQAKAAFFLVAITPFDAILLEYPVYGLFLPGVGDDKYYFMSSALFSILQKNLPTTNSDIANQIAIVGNLGNDGYLLLWNVLKLTIPAFDNQKSQTEPLWRDYRDIAKFATAYTTFHQFERFRGRELTDKEKSLKFLGGIKETAYSGVLATLRIQIQSYIPEEGDAHGSLPIDLQMGSLAITIKDQMEGMIIDSDLDLTCRVNRILWVNPRVHAASTHFLLDSDSDDSSIVMPFELPGIDPIVRAARDQRRPSRKQHSDGEPPRDAFRRPR